MKKVKLLISTLLAGTMLFSLAACGSTSTAETSEAAPASEAASSMASEAAAESTAEPAADGDNPSVALMLPGSLNDGGWNANAYAGLTALEDEGYTVAFTESIPVASIEEAFNNYASNGFDLIIGHGFEFGEPAMRVAPNFPDVNFFVSGKMPDGVAEEDLLPNISFMDMKEYEAAYLAGIVAGGMTESNSIGYVAGLEIPAQIANMGAFVNGVASYNPDAQVFGVVTGTFEDPSTGQEAALAQIDSGADIICHTANSTGVGAMEAAASEGVYIIGYGSDQNEAYPDLVLTSIVTDNAGVVELQAEKVKDGSFGGLWRPGVAEGVVSITPYHGLEDEIPDEVKAAVDEAIAGMMDGSLVVEEVTERIDQTM